MSSARPIFKTTALDLKPTYGWIFVGAIFAAVFYGVTIVQTLFYFQTYPNDRISVKGLVVGLWILDTLSLIFLAHGTYTSLIIDFANPLALNDLLWTILAEPLCTATIALCVHLFMAYRIYILKPKLVLLALFIAMLSFVPFGVGIADIVIGVSTRARGLARLRVNLHWTIMMAVGIVFTASLDVVIATTLVMILHMHGNLVSLKKTNKMISTLTVYLVTNNLLTSFITLALLISFFASPRSLVYEAFNMVISKAYTNTFLAQLNARQSIQGRGITSTQGPATLSIRFNIRSMSATNPEFDVETTDPRMNSSSFNNTLQNPSTSGIAKNEKVQKTSKEDEKERGSL